MQTTTNPKEIAGWAVDAASHAISKTDVETHGFVRARHDGAGVVVPAGPGERATIFVVAWLSDHDLAIVPAAGVYPFSALAAVTPGALLYPHSSIAGRWQTATNGDAFARHIGSGVLVGLAGDNILDTVQQVPVQTAKPATPAAGNVTEPYYKDNAWQYEDQNGNDYPVAPQPRSVAPGLIAPSRRLNVVTTSTQVTVTAVYIAPNLGVRRTRYLANVNASASNAGLPVSEFCFVYVYADADGSNVGVHVQKADEAVILPGTPDNYGRVGYVRTDAAGQFIPQSQNGNIISFPPAARVNNGGSLVDTPVVVASDSCPVPPVASLLLGFMRIQSDPGTAGLVWLTNQFSGAFVAAASDLNAPGFSFNNVPFVLPYGGGDIPSGELAYRVAGTNPSALVLVSGYQLGD